MPGQVIERRKGGTVLVATGGPDDLAIELVSLAGGERVRPAEIIKSIRSRLE